MSEEGGQVWALCEQPDRDRVVKGSIATLIIDKYKGEGRVGERGEERERQRVVVVVLFALVTASSR